MTISDMTYKGLSVFSDTPSMVLVHGSSFVCRWYMSMYVRRDPTNMSFSPTPHETTAFSTTKTMVPCPTSLACPQPFSVVKLKESMRISDGRTMDLCKRGAGAIYFRTTTEGSAWHHIARRRHAHFLSKTHGVARRRLGRAWTTKLCTIC